MDMPSDRVRKTITNYGEMFKGENTVKFISYVENTLRCAEISAVNKTDIKAFRMY